MADMEFIAIFKEDGGVVERKVGFHSRDVLYYSATNNPEITAVEIVKQGVKEVLFVKSTPHKFHREKEKAEDADLFLINGNLN